MLAEERTLVLEAAKGNTDAFGQLIRKYQNAVYAVVYSQTNDFHAAEDVAQDVFVKAWHRISQLNDPGKFGSWILSISRNAVVD